MNRDIKDYLHLYLGCEVQMNVGQKKRAYFTGIDRYGYVIVTFENSVGKQTHGHYRLESLIPTLRPLSDMTEDEKFEFQDICECEKEDLGCVTYSSFLNDAKKSLGTAHLTNVLQWAKGVNYLRSRSIDVDGLIESGLAFDKTKLNRLDADKRSVAREE